MDSEAWSNHHDCVDILKGLQPNNAPLDAVITSISLHISRQDALASGLFGLLGDAPVQTLAYDDAAKLRAFQGFLRHGSLLDKELDADRELSHV